MLHGKNKDKEETKFEGESSVERFLTGSSVYAQLLNNQPLRSPTWNA